MLIAETTYNLALLDYSLQPFADQVPQPLVRGSRDRSLLHFLNKRHTIDLVQSCLPFKNQAQR